MLVVDDYDAPTPPPGATPIASSQYDRPQAQRLAQSKQSLCAMLDTQRPALTDAGRSATTSRDVLDRIAAKTQPPCTIASPETLLSLVDAELITMAPAPLFQGRASQGPSDYVRQRTYVAYLVPGVSPDTTRNDFPHAAG